MSPKKRAWKNGCPERASNGSTDAFGQAGERLAERYFISAGYRLLARRWQTGTIIRGELDLVVRQGDEIVFVEVKARSSDEYGTPEAAITPQKRRVLIRTAQIFLRQRGWSRRRWRMDVVGIEMIAGAPPRLRHWIGAVTPCDDR